MSIGYISVSPGYIELEDVAVWDDAHFKLAVVLGAALTIVLVVILVPWLCCAYQRHFDGEMRRLTKLALLRDMPRSHDTADSYEFGTSTAVMTKCSLELEL